MELSFERSLDGYSHGIMSAGDTTSRTAESRNCPSEADKVSIRPIVQRDFELGALGQGRSTRHLEPDYCRAQARGGRVSEDGHLGLIGGGSEHAESNR